MRQQGNDVVAITYDVLVVTELGNTYLFYSDGIVDGPPFAVNIFSSYEINCSIFHLQKEL
jgi:hypothetical protein